MEIVNLTPHTVAFYDEDDSELILDVEPCGVVARCEETTIRIGTAMVGGKEVPIVVKMYFPVLSLPDPRPGVLYLVSALTMVQAARAGRQDVVCPGDLVRDESRNVIGCRSLCGPESWLRGNRAVDLEVRFGEFDR
jgi:hypothetical protein